MNRNRVTKWAIKPLVFVGLLIPLAALVRDSLTGNLTANPIEDITHRLGGWGLGILLGTLAITPLRRLTGWSQLISLRRMMGLFAFCYLSLHFLTWVVLDQFFSVPDMVQDVAKRPYITVGFAGYLMLVPLAVTSTKKMVRRLGGRRWARLHRLVYVAAAAGVLHFLWLVKADTRDPTIFGIVLIVLLALRIRVRRGRQRAAAGVDVSG